MSLKIFHLIFVTAATILAVGCGVWGFKDYFSAGGRTLDLFFGIGSFVVAVALILYERYFIKKTRNVSYL